MSFEARKAEKEDFYKDYMKIPYNYKDMEYIRKLAVKYIEVGVMRERKYWQKIVEEVLFYEKTKKE